jgi:beta-lactamase class D
LDGAVLSREGTLCDERTSPASTFKVALSVMQQYVDALGYGNRDLRGEPGKNDGLTTACLSTSLEISPVEQAAFLRALLQHALRASPVAIDHTMAIMPSFAIEAGEGSAPRLRQAGEG